MYEGREGKWERAGEGSVLTNNSPLIEFSRAIYEPKEVLIILEESFVGLQGFGEQVVRNLTLIAGQCSLVEPTPGGSLDLDRLHLPDHSPNSARNKSFSQSPPGTLANLPMPPQTNRLNANRTVLPL